MFQCHVNVPPVCSKSRLSETEQYTYTHLATYSYSKSTHLAWSKKTKRPELARMSHRANRTWPDETRKVGSYLIDLTWGFWLGVYQLPAYCVRVRVTKYIYRYIESKYLWYQHTVWWYLVFGVSSYFIIWYNVCILQFYLSIPAGSSVDPWFIVDNCVYFSRFTCGLLFVTI